MNPKKIWSNLMVSDLDRTTKFYTALGFKSNGRSEELTGFFWRAEFYNTFLFDRKAESQCGDG
ncbi:hypothetical protein D3C87_1427040 [compost metagenome]